VPSALNTIPFSQEPIIGSLVDCVWLVTGSGAGVEFGDIVDVRVGVTSTVSLTICGVGVASGAVPVEPVFVHPLIKTIPITRTVKIPIAFHFFIVCSLNNQPYSAKYIPITTKAQ
jgi:hypothetical protein